MGNCIQKKKFLVKNKTEFNIFFQITEKKLTLDVADIRPGKVVNIQRQAEYDQKFLLCF